MAAASHLTLWALICGASLHPYVMHRLSQHLVTGVMELQQRGQMAAGGQEPILTKTEPQLLQYLAQMERMGLQAPVMLAKELPSLRCHFLWLVELLGLRGSQAMAAVAEEVVLFTTLLTGLLQALLGLMAVGQMQGLGAKQQPHI